LPSLTDLRSAERWPLMFVIHREGTMNDAAIWVKEVEYFLDIST
jgi:hypothetical protein